MSTKHFAVIGHPIGHTMSPFIHAELFRLNGIDGDYAIVDIAPDTLGTEIPRLLRELDGFNVTIPYKSAVIPFLDAVEGVAKEYGSVNTVRCADRSGRTDCHTYTDTCSDPDRHSDADADTEAGMDGIRIQRYRLCHRRSQRQNRPGHGI